MKLHCCLCHALLHLFHGHQMAYRANHAANLGCVIMNHRSVQFSKPERPDCSLLGFLSIDGASYLRNL